MEFNDFEKSNVKDVYNKIASNFDVTRRYYWKCVKDYIYFNNNNNNNNYNNIINNKIKILDVGCGNGRYIPLMNNFDIYAIDNSEELLKIVNDKYPFVKTFCNDVTSLNFENNLFDNIISIAVIHHLSTEERRIKMINEIIRVLKPGGTALITAWSNSIKKDKFNILDGNNNYMIPWNNQYYRFYHLFDIYEFDKLLEKSNYYSNIKINKKIYEYDNWCIIIEKL
jgi:tRNA (uracil-5-)-methyltransferase TRM9